MAHSGINVLFEGRNLIRLFGGLWTTVEIAGVALILGLLLGIVLGVLRTFPNRLLRLVLRLYLEFFRITPTVVLLFLFYYILPRQLGVNLPANQMAMLAFALWTSAEMSDIVRGALISVPKHQRESGMAIGLNRWQLYRYVLIPQAVSLELPATVNLVTRVIKTTSVLMLISVMDVINVGQQVVEANNQKFPTGVFWVYGMIFVMYFAIDYPLSWWAKRLDKKRLERANG
ncbi:amino acid ABC transporter permease protein [Secundilactobacillus pentosiphilus]|uniref:Amino acid ABC transporter permease protein n=1 Tax=Secundilactobacillus pentosiphilus TaxID=1714682 RepID=A0A1Z5IVW6_9LACO|nr:amino acid ABC transporter permease [Secundilactobacillus pentosiphilus]GAX05829.1 amino acid ABC transporter permease protein [Secundilactobacillus pentosiphilus]